MKDINTKTPPTTDINEGKSQLTDAMKNMSGPCK